MRYLIVDISTVLYRFRYGTSTVDRELAKAECINNTFVGLQRAFTTFNIDHIVVAFDSLSWRYSMYPAYKANRKDRKKKKDLIVREDVKELCGILYDFINSTTAMSAVRVDGAEADDIVAQWVMGRPDDEHVIYSGDSDFRQLLAPNISLYSAKDDVLWMHDIVLYRDNLKLNDWKVDGQTKIQREAMRFDTKWKVKHVKKSGVVTSDEEIINPAWSLFEKIMRGDKGDNITQAVPKRFAVKKIVEAFNDPTGAKLDDILELPREDEGFGVTVRDLFERNIQLVSLDNTPPAVCQAIQQEFAAQGTKPIPRLVKIEFIKMCRRFHLPALEQRAQFMLGMLAKRPQQLLANAS